MTGDVTIHILPFGLAVILACRVAQVTWLNQWTAEEALRQSVFAFIFALTSLYFYSDRGHD